MAWLKGPLCVTPVAAVLTVWAAQAMPAAQAVEFDAGLLRQGTAVNLQRFQGQAVVHEGDVQLDIVLNQQWKGRHVVRLRRQAAEADTTPCFDANLLQTLGVDFRALPAPVQETLQHRSRCLGLPMLGLTASEQLDLPALRLTLQIAQQALQRLPQGYLAADTWDSGVAAGFIDYRFNLHQQRDLRARHDTRQAYLGLRTGVNTGQWYWRHEGDWQQPHGASPRYQAGMTWVRRDVPAWSAQLTLGDGHSSSTVFEGSAFRGALLASDERMQPASQRGFAPVVRGVANSTALLSIRQRGVLLHESTVAPGPFEIDDLYASGLNDDLEVTLREADGSVRTFTQPYQAAPLALRPGAHRFELNGGRWRDDFGGLGPEFLQGSWQQGLDNHLSLHGGGWLSDGYLASALGAAINSDAGALGLTWYQSRATLPDHPPRHGQALRLSWRTRLAGTDLSATLSQSDSPAYLGFDAFARASEGRRHAPSRWRAGLNASHALPGGGGRLQLTASSQQGWAGPGMQTSYALSYTHHHGAFSYGASLRREQRPDGQPLNTLSFNVGLPLGERRRSSISSQYSHDSQGRSVSHLRWSGIAGNRSQWGYGVGAVRQVEARTRSGFDANVQHRGASGDLSLSVAGREGYRQFSLGARGSLVGHAGTVIAGPSVGESFAIVHAPGAADARLRQHPHVRLDRRGYAVVPALQPYSLNTVELDPQGMTRDVELQATGQSLVPRAGAAALLRFPTQGGRFWMFDARHTDGRPLPFGAGVYDDLGDPVGMVGQGSRLHLRSHREPGRLRVAWGDEADQQCWLLYEATQAPTCS